MQFEICRLMDVYARANLMRIRAGSMMDRNEQESAGPEFHKEPIPCLKPLVAGHHTRTPTVRLKPRPHFLVIPHSSRLPQHLIVLSNIIQIREDTY